MALLRLTILGAAAYAMYRYVTSLRPAGAGAHTHDGLAAIYRTREQADLAIEHLVQEYGVSRSAIFVEPVDERNSSGTEISGGDAPSGGHGSRVRDDAPLNGAIRLTVAATEHELALLRQTLNNAGALEVQSV